MSARRILLADDDAAIRTVLNQALSRAGYLVRSTGNIATLWNWIDQGEGDVVVTDVAMPDGCAFDLLPLIKKQRPELPVIVMSAQNTFLTAIKASERGAYEYLPKPFDLKELLSVVGRSLTQMQNQRSVDNSAQEEENMPLIGRSPAMQEIYRILTRLMPTDLTVVISGESGTGKELVARALHDYGKRRLGPFISVNMAAIPRNLIEAELFGEEKHDLSEGEGRNIGYFEQAEGGTLFLDEIGDMPMEAQARLLRVLQQGEYTAIGGRRSIKADVRIIAATNKDMRLLIREGLFREDLFFRLNVISLRLPALRDRLEDVPDLVHHFFHNIEQEGYPRKHLDAGAMNRLKKYSWPGNVRELENMVRRLAALYPQEMITSDIIDLELDDARDFLSTPYQTNSDSSVSDMRSLSCNEGLTEALERYLSSYFSSFSDALPPAGLYHRVIREIEAPLLAAALAATNGNQIKAAELLGVNRNTLRKKMQDLSLKKVRLRV